MPLVIVIETDRVKGRGKLPRIRAISCDGYMVFSEKEIDKNIECAVTAHSHGPGSVRAMVRALQAAENNVDSIKYGAHYLTDAMRDELEKIAEEEKKERKEKGNGRGQKEADRKGTETSKG